MKNNYRRVSALLKMIPVNNFLSVNFGNYDCNLIAYFSPQIMTKVLSHKFKVVEDNDSHFLKFRRGNITISITDK
jgi:hypothetical protein